MKGNIFERVNILQQKYYAFFYKDKYSFDIVTDIKYGEYEDMSNKAKAFYKYESKNGDIIPEDWDDWNSTVTADYRYFFCDFLEYFDTSFEETKRMFDIVSDLYDGLSEKRKEHIMLVQLHLAKKEYLEYMSYNDFSIDFLERFANSKNILFNRILTKRNGQKLDINDNTSDIAYRYESTNIRDIIFASIHFALENGYKLSQCSHCGRWFFKDGSRAGSRKKYCNRKSTFNGYEHLPCEQAVRNINQELQREKKRIYNSMVREHLSTEQFVYDFLDECAEYMTKIKKCASVQNLSDYWTFLKKYKDGVKNGNNK